MVKTTNREERSFSFSYLDVFFLLLVGFVLSLGIYFSTEGKRQEEQVPLYQVEVSSYYRSEIRHAIPTKGDVLFNEEGESIGEVLEVDTYEAEGKNMFFLTLLIKSDPGETGEAFVVETVRSRNTATILAVTEYEKGDAV